jgi:YrbI family 3-deoxy-D-manno-octulosonate 8-phosphate phosphatase
LQAARAPTTVVGMNTDLSSKTCAIIPARGGSKGIPGKNLRMIAGKPLLAHCVVAALESRTVGRVFVSTDDTAIAEVARAFGAEVIIRPAALASDTASSESALLHGLETLAAEGGYQPELLVFLQCTSPLMMAADIDGTVDALLEQGADSALSVARFHYHLWRTDPQEGAVGVNHDKRVRLRRQEREPEFVETGAVYAMRVAGFLAARHRFFGKTVSYEMPAERAQEVDEPVDLEIVEVLLRRQQQQARAARLPARIDCIVFDFDGVLTDNLVQVDQTGRESVTCSRGDGLGLSELRARAVPLLVLSKEQNPVVAARCQKLQIPFLQGIDAKLPALREYCDKHGFAMERVVYVGNDVNDLECLAAVGCGVAVADAHPEAKRHARLILTAAGGRGAVRELCDLVIEQLAS